MRVSVSACMRTCTTMMLLVAMIVEVIVATNSGGISESVYACAGEQE